MTKADLIQLLADVPDDAEVVAFNDDHGGNCPVTGIVHGLVNPNNGHHLAGCRMYAETSRYAAGPDQRDEWEHVVELFTDDNT